MLKARSDNAPSAHSSVQKESSQATRSSVTHHDVMYLLQWHATRSQLPTDAPTGALISLIQFSKNESDVVRPQAASRFVDSYSVYAFNPRLTWWSRWGSNPRPQACKARALPTELRPLRRTLFGALSSADPRAHPVRFRDGQLGNRNRAPDELPCSACSSLEWWAWKDLNFRPHAYQACALTN